MAHRSIVDPCAINGPARSDGDAVPAALANDAIGIEEPSSSGTQPAVALSAVNATAGGKSHLGSRVGVLAAIIGAILLVAFARSSREVGGGVAPRFNLDHWDSAYGLYLCDRFSPPLVDRGSSTGIHTHADGAIHVHPRSRGESGENAMLGRFADQVGLKLSSDSITLPDGRKYTNGDECSGQPGIVQVARWDDVGAIGNQPTETVTRDPSRIRFRKDGEAFTIAFVPRGARIPPPETATRLKELRE